MRKIRANYILGLFILTVLTIVGTIIYAQEQKPSTVVILGGLKLKDGADVASAEKLFQEQLITAMKDIQGVKMKVLKKMPLPNEKSDTDSYGYIMMAEVENPLALMQLMQSNNRNPKLEEFGKMMKEYASGPSLKAYVVIGDTETKEEQK